MKYKSELIYSANLMGILQDSPDNWLGIGKTGDSDESEKIENLIKERNDARASKNFQRADESEMARNSTMVATYRYDFAAFMANSREH